MNERIGQLVEQAGIITNLDTNFFEKDPNKWIDYFAEKFAELIIKESIEIMKAKDYHGVWLGEQIKEHFGIDQ